MRAILFFLAVVLSAAELNLNFNNIICDTPAQAGEPTEKHVPAGIATILARGWLNCAAPSGGPLFGNVTAGTDIGPGYWADICRAHAAALFPDFHVNHQNRLKFTIVNSGNRWDLHEQGVNVVAYSSTKTTARLIEKPAYFSPITIYDYGAIAVWKSSNVNNSADLMALPNGKYCFGAGTTGADSAAQFSNLTPTPYPTTNDAIAAFLVAGTCTAIATDFTDLLDRGVATNPLVQIIHKFSEEPLAAFTFSVDLQVFSETVINGLIAAHERNYTWADAVAGKESKIYPPKVGESLFGFHGNETDFMRTVVAEVGNLDQIYLRYFPATDRKFTDLPQKGGLEYATP
jgi:ABC-type amino acid transport substrate-binding protein